VLDVLPGRMPDVLNSTPGVVLGRFLKRCGVGEPFVGTLVAIMAGYWSDGGCMEDPIKGEFLPGSPLNHLEDGGNQLTLEESHGVTGSHRRRRSRIVQRVYSSLLVVWPGSVLTGCRSESTPGGGPMPIAVE